MLRRQNIFFLLAFLTLSPVAIRAQERPGASWLEAAPGARAAALSEAVTAAAEGPVASYWNPAAVGLEPGIELMHADWWVESSSVQHLAASFSSGRFGWGASLHHVGSYDLQLRDGPSAEPDGSFDSRSFSAGLSTSAEVVSGWRAGLSGRYLSESIYTEHAGGYSVDFGLLRRGLVSGALDLGLAVRHIGAMDSFAGGSSDLPTTVSAGARYRLPLGPSTPSSLMADVVSVRGYDPAVRVGAETLFFNALALRAGWQSGEQQNNISAGFGLRWRQWSFEMSLSPYENDLGTTQRFSIRADW